MNTTTTDAGQVKLEALRKARLEVVKNGREVNLAILRLLSEVGEYNARAEGLAPPVEIETGRHLQGTVTVLERWLRKEGAI